MVLCVQLFQVSPGVALEMHVWLGVGIQRRVDRRVADDWPLLRLFDPAGCHQRRQHDRRQLRYGLVRQRGGLRRSVRLRLRYVTLYSTVRLVLRKHFHARFPLTRKVRETSGTFVGGEGKIPCTIRLSICCCSIVSDQKCDDLCWISSLDFYYMFYFGILLLYVLLL